MYMSSILILASIKPLGSLPFTFYSPQNVRCTLFASQGVFKKCSFNIVFKNNELKRGTLIGDSFAGGTGMGTGVAALGCLGMVSTKKPL